MEEVYDYNKEELNYNGEPKPGMEYVYRLDMVWQKGVNGHIAVELNSIVTDVVPMYRNGDKNNKIDGYEFTLKSNGERYYCYYAWALAENTENNAFVTNTLEGLKRVIDSFQKIYDDKYKELKTLAKKQ
jgi:hypothetical protein